MGEESNKIGLKKQITLFQGVGIIVGIIIGSGIFVSPVGILMHTKSVGFSMLMWVICGVFNTLCALCYAELGAAMPETGGEYIYIKRAFGDYPAFLCMWINFLLICPVGAAALSLIASLYILKPIFPDCEIPSLAQRLLAICITWVLVSINMRNVKWTTRVQLVITASKLIALVVIIVLGMIALGKGEVDSFENSFADSDFSGGAIALSFYSGFWAFSGWSYLNFLTGEMVNPGRNLPLAILISMSLVLVVYLITNVAYLAVLSPALMLESTAVAVTFASQTMGVMQWSMPILIAISTCGTLNGIFLSMSRLFYTGAVNNHMPQFMAMIQYKFMTPASSLFVICLVTLAFQMSDDIWFLIEMEGFGFASVLTMVCASQVWLRFKEPNLKRPIKMPIALPIILGIISLAIVILTFIQKTKESLLALFLVAVGTVLYIIGNRWTKKPIAIQSKITGINIFFQKLLLIVPPESEKDLQFD